VPGAADRIIKMAERQMRHRQSLERQVIKSDTRRSWFGLWTGFVIALACIGSGAFLVHGGHDVAGSSFVASTVVGLAAVFIGQKVARGEEQAEKKRALTKKR
jgi:uncharacterized membrane protein